jgi:hypothetical protein
MADRLSRRDGRKQNGEERDVNMVCFCVFSSVSFTKLQN